MKRPKNLLLYSNDKEYEIDYINYISVIKDETSIRRVIAFEKNMSELFLAIEKSGIMTVNDKYILIFSMFEDEKELLINDLESTNYIRERNENKFTLINGYQFILNIHE
jgi:hypothetical protein